MKYTDEQTRAIEAPLTSLQVIEATAGSGKTTTAAERIRFLLRHGVGAETIIALTFTRAGGKALQEKVGTALGFAGTLHAFAMSELDIGPESVLSEEEAEDAIRATIEDLQLTVTPTEATAAMADPEPAMGNAALFLRAFALRMGDAGTTTFDMILRDYLHSGKAAARYAAVLLIDEAQDTAPMDAAIYKAIAPAGGTIVIGDPNQAIYGFRGAKDRFMKQAIRAGENYPLSATFRCSHRVTEVANDLLLTGQPMQARPEAPEGHTTATRFENQRAEEDHLLDWAKHQLEWGRSAAILTLYNHNVERIRDAFASAGIEVEPRLRSRGSATKRLTLAVLRGMIDGRPLDAIASHHPKAAEIVKRWGSNQGLLARFEGQGMARKLEFCGIATAEAWSLDGQTATQAIDGLLESEETQDDTGLHIDTIHSSKGREFDAVILAAADETIDTAQQAQNLAYVATTRARLDFATTYASEAIDGWTGRTERRAASAIFMRTRLNAQG